MGEFHFRKQHSIGNYIVDFYCAEKSIVLEVDGSSHEGREDYDAARDAFLTGLGLTVVHISAREVKNNLPDVMNNLREHQGLH